jgi:hypothetical protein
MPAEQAQKYMKELRARNVPYSFLPLSHGLVTVSTSGAFAIRSYDAFMRVCVPKRSDFMGEERAFTFEQGPSDKPIGPDGNFEPL